MCTLSRFKSYYVIIYSLELFVGKGQLPIKISFVLLPDSDGLTTFNLWLFKYHSFNFFYRTSRINSFTIRTIYFNDNFNGYHMAIM